MFSGLGSTVKAIGNNERSDRMEYEKANALQLQPFGADEQTRLGGRPEPIYESGADARERSSRSGKPTTSGQMAQLLRAL